MCGCVCGGGGGGRDGGGRGPGKSIRHTVVSYPPPPRYWVMTDRGKAIMNNLWRCVMNQNDS